MKKLRSQCPNDPKHPTSYWYSQWDSFACLTCDIWTEPACQCPPENHCRFQRTPRPEKPSQTKCKE